MPSSSWTRTAEARRVGWGALLVGVFGALGCAPVPASPEPSAASTPAPPAVTEAAGAPLVFSFPEVRGKADVTGESLRGRISIVGFVTTYDLPSQAQVRYLNQLAREHVPRLNVALLVLEPPENREIAAAFADMLGLKYPVAMADAATIRGEGPFAGLHHVPSLVILDREGRERYRYLGMLDAAKLEQAVVDVERVVGPPK